MIKLDGAFNCGFTVIVDKEEEIKEAATKKWHAIDGFGCPVRVYPKAIIGSWFEPVEKEKEFPQCHPVLMKLQ